MMISELNIKEDEFDMFITFNASEKIEFLSDALEYGVEIAMLNQVCDISEDEPPLGVIILYMPMLVYVSPPLKVNCN